MRFRAEVMNEFDRLTRSKIGQTSSVEFLCEVFAVTRVNQFPRQIAQCTRRSGRALGQSEDFRVFVLCPYVL
jgi:hypothetical protein